MKFEKSESRKMKAKILWWLRIHQRCAFLATEVGRFSADCLGINEKRMIEVEVKISLEDIRADFRKQKHRQYDPKDYEPSEARWIPTHFYFAVPQDLVDPLQAVLKEKGYEKYGILNMSGDAPVVVRRAQWLHKREPASEAKFTLALRMGSELLRFHEAYF